MPLPKYTKFSKDGFTFEDHSDRCIYTLKELIRGALRDVGKYICKETRKLIHRRTGKLAKNTQYWVKSKEDIPSLEVGFKPGGWYGLFQEIGTINVEKVGALSDTVEKNISTIMLIESQYLSTLEDKAKALSLIDEEETISNDEN
ncbi:MAG: hypothetical protein ACI4WH_07700 [Oscillospiraceae bacterium]